MDNLPTKKKIAGPDAQQIEAIISRGLAAQAPARTFRKLTAVPYLPPTGNVANILKKKCNTAPTPDHDWLRTLDIDGGSGPGMYDGGG